MWRKSEKSNGASKATPSKSGWTNILGLLTLGILMVGGIGYYKYISDKEAYLIDRDFRLLATWSNELSTTLMSYEKVFESSVTAADSKVENYSNNDRLIFQHTQQRAFKASTSKEILERLPESRLKNPDICFMKGPYNEEKKKCDQNVQIEKASSQGLTISTQRQFSGNFFHLRWGPKDKLNAIITADIEMSSLLEEIVKEPLFQDVLLANPKGKVVYQKNPIQYRWSELQVLLQHQVPEGFLSSLFSATKQDGDSPSEEGTPTDIPKPALRTVSLGGTTYHVFIQPVFIPSLESSQSPGPGDHQQQQQSQWILAGLIPSQTFRNEYLSIPYTYSLIFTFLVLMLFLSMPLIRLWMMNAFERIRLFNVLSIALTSLIGTAVITFMFCDTYFYFSAKAVFQDQLKSTGELIHKTFQLELRRMLWQLEQYDLSAELTQDLSTVLKHDLQIKGDLSVARPSMTKHCPEDTNNPDLTPSQFCYGDYDLVFWMDLQGNLVVNWARERKYSVNGIMNLREREYVQRIRNPEIFPHKRLWHLDLNLKDTYEKPDFRFFIEPIISWTTGQNSIVLSMPSSRITTNSQGDNLGLQVAAMETRLTSLMQEPVVPKGTGFAVIQDHDGRVLFHSQRTRNLREDFFAETDNNEQLKGLVAARNGGFFEGQYWGTGHQFYVQPIDHLPWSLVVYRDKSLLRTTNFEILLLSGSLFTIYAIVILGILFLGLFLARSVLLGRASWMWPSSSLNVRYHFLTIGNLLLLIGESWFFQTSSFSATTNLALVIGIPFAWMLLVFLWVSRFDPSQAGSQKGVKSTKRWEARLLPFRDTYVAMVLSFLLVLSVWPASLLFQMAQKAEMTLLTKFSLLEFGRPLVKYQKINKVSPRLSDLEETPFKTLANLNRCSSPNEHNSSKCHFYTFTTPELASQGVFKDFSFPTSLFFAPENEVTESSELRSEPRGIFERFHKFIRIPSLHGIKSRETWGLISSPDSALTRLQVVSQEDHLWKVSDQYLFLLLPYIPKPEETHEIYSDPGTIYVISPMATPFQSQAWVASLISSENGAWYLFLGFIIGFLWILHKGIFRRIFLLDRNAPNPGPPRLITAMNEKGFAPHLLILGPPGSGKSRWLQKQKATNWNCEDLRKIMESADAPKWKPSIIDRLTKTSERPDWARSIIARLNRNTRVVALDHFEFQMGISVDDEEKQHLLRQLLMQEDLRIIILSTVDPTRAQFSAIPSSESEENQDISSANIHKDPDHWAALLESFVTVHYREPGESGEEQGPCLDLEQSVKQIIQTHHQGESLAKNLLQECHINQHLRNLGRWLTTQSGWQSMTEDQFFSHILDLARTHYLTIWSACTLEEKLALFFLAKDRFLHYRHPGLRLALEKGLIVWGPDLEVMNESFRRFVLEVGHHENLLSYEKAGGASLWTLVKWPLVLVVLVGIVFLVGTQQEFRTSLVTLVSVLPVLLPALSELPGIVQGHRVGHGTGS